MSDQTHKRSILDWEYFPLVILLVVCIVVFCAGMYITFFLGGGRPTSANEFGDSAGAVNGLFSALAFAGVIFAIILQKKELSLQRQELEDTRKELEAQKDEFIEQNKTLRHQRFEDTFFNMMHLQQSITNSLTYTLIVNVRQEDGSYKEIRENYQGRDVFKAIFENASVRETEDSRVFIGMRDYLIEKGLEAYKRAEITTRFDHYFRHLYRMLKFVTYSPLIDDSERYEYSALIRSQLSRYELVWLYYNGLTFGKAKLKPFIQTYSMLQNLRRELLVQGLRIDDGYTNAAFLRLG